MIKECGKKFDYDFDLKDHLDIGENLGIIDMKRAAKSYQNAFQMNEIGDLTKEMMLQKSNDMKALTPKK